MNKLLLRASWEKSYAQHLLTGKICPKELITLSIHIVYIYIYDFKRIYLQNLGILKFTIHAKRGEYRSEIKECPIFHQGIELAAGIQWILLCTQGYTYMYHGCLATVGTVTEKICTVILNTKCHPPKQSYFF